MTYAFSQAITLIARTPDDDDDGYGNATYTDTTTVVQGVFAPGGSVEKVYGQDQVTTQPTAYLPDMALTAIDRVQVGGQLYDVDGDPLNWPVNPFTGWRPDYPLEVRLKAVTG